MARSDEPPRPVVCSSARLHHDATAKATREEPCKPSPRHLLEFVGISACEFSRNGSWYDAKRAQAHLRSKYQWLVARDQIRTAEDFIEKAATSSSLSGRPYEVRCGVGEAVPSNRWLRDELTRHRTPGSGQTERAPRTIRGCARDRCSRLDPEAQSSFLILMLLWTPLTPSVPRAMDTALSISCCEMARSLSHHSRRQ